MSTTDVGRTGSKELDALQRRLKPGYAFERTRGGHYRLRAPNGKLVQYEGKNLTLTPNASPGVQRAIRAELEHVGALKRHGDARSWTPSARASRMEALRATNAAREAARKIEADELRARLQPILDRVAPGAEHYGVQADLAYVGALVARELGEERMTPDLLQGNAARLLSGSWVERRYQRVWNALVDKIEHAADPQGEWYSLVRIARGLPDDAVSVRKVEDDWPFRVELIPLDRLFVADEYQRPVPWPFVRKLAQSFDESLVGTIDVAQRSPSRFAVLDGQTRAATCRLVGKTTIHCSIYAGLSLEDEARFFLKKNRDRRAMHPYYTFRAKATAGDPDTLAIQRIASERGYRIQISAPRADVAPGAVASIAALEAVYAMRLDDGTSALAPTLDVLKRATWGRENGQNGALIRGVAHTIVDEGIDVDSVAHALDAIGPTLVLGRARDLSRLSGGAIQKRVADVLAAESKRARRKAA